MKLIIGLGNPGLSYQKTRHNLGARAIKEVAKEYKVRLRLNRSLKSRIAQIEISGLQCLIAIPNTFMNLSGEAVGLLLQSKRISLKDLLIIYDDIDLELGAMRFKKSGSSGGHRGVRSIIRVLNTQGFNRLKLGIGRSFCKENTKDYVLSNFIKKEIRTIDPLTQIVARACGIWAKFGIDRAMNEFN